MKNAASKESVKLWRPPELGGVELLRAHYVTQNFARHTHDGYAVGIIERGAMEFYYRGENVVAPHGQVNLVVPGEIHTGHAATEGGWTYRMFYLDADVLQRVASQMAGRPQGLPFLSRGVLQDEALAGMVRSLHAVMEAGSSPRIEIESRLLAMLTHLLSRHAEPAPVKRPVGREPRGVRQVQEYIEAHFEENISVETLAAIAHLSPYHFIRVFNNHLGMPPHAYLMQRRVRKARELLDEGWRIVDAACDAGFVDQSHLTKHFKRTYGFTPGQYRNSVQDA